MAGSEEENKILRILEHERARPVAVLSVVLDVAYLPSAGLACLEGWVDGSEVAVAALIQHLAMLLGGTASCVFPSEGHAQTPHAKLILW